MPTIDYTRLPQRDIIAIDVKSFFASVEAVKRGLHPLHAYIIVLSGSVVLAASPRVKSEFGIKTGSRSYEIPKDPKLLIVSPHMGEYLQVNEHITKILKKYVADEDLLVYSIDEMLLDVTTSRHLFGSVEEVGKKIQLEIWHTLRLVVTIGIGPNPLMAKVCMDIEAKKSANCFAKWTYEDVPTKLQKIEPLTEFWGIGKKTAEKLKLMGIHNVQQLANANVHLLKRRLGIIGEELYYHAHGVDYTRLSERHHPKNKSYGSSQILMRDYTNSIEIKRVLREMADQVATRLRQNHMQAALIKLNIGFSQKGGFSCQQTIAHTNSTKKITHHLLELFHQKYQGETVRSIAIACGKISPQGTVQLNLFEDPDQVKAEATLERVVDKVRQRYGFASLVRASSLQEGATAIQRSTYIGGHQG